VRHRGQINVGLFLQIQKKCHYCIFKSFWKKLRVDFHELSSIFDN